MREVGAGFLDQLASVPAAQIDPAREVLEMRGSRRGSPIKVQEPRGSRAGGGTGSVRGGKSAGEESGQLDEAGQQERTVFSGEAWSDDDERYEQDSYDFSDYD